MEHREVNRSLPLSLKLIIGLILFFGVNWIVQVIRKPSELAGLLLPTNEKSAAATWNAYGSIFEDNSTEIMAPELLAAIAQIESSGNPAARTYWRWNMTLHPFRIYTPASSAVGLFQVTDGTYGRCRDLCIRGGQVRSAGSWYDPASCWFNWSYNRLVPSHSVEMMSACLHRQAEKLVQEGGLRSPSLRLKQDVAVVSHLCGPRARAVDALKRGRSVPKGERCGDHDPAAYLSRVRALRGTFARLRVESGRSLPD